MKKEKYYIRLFKSVLLLSGIVAFLLSTSYAQQTEFVGSWKGKINVGVELPVVLHIKIEEGKYSATLDSPDQNAYDIKVDEITTEGKKITLVMESIGGKYEGTLSEDSKKISGTIFQGGASFPLELSLTETKEEIVDEIAYESLWQGKLSISGVELRLVFKIYKSEDKLQVHLDSPDQGAKNIKGDVDYYNKDSVKFTFTQINGRYEGKFENENTIIGKWYQAALNLDLVLGKVDKVVEVKRPQEPQPPYPYKEEEVKFKNEKADITLDGTLTIPEGSAQFPAVVMVSGSGPQDRDENILNHKPFKVIADYLTRNGIAVLRYDDRGVGKSEGDFGKAISTDFANDAIAAVEYLASRTDVIDANKIGIAGHSEGGMIAPMAANRSESVSFIILLAGPGTTGEQILIDQSRLILEASGVSKSYIDKQEKLIIKIYEVIKSEKDDSIATEKISLYFDDFTAQLTDEEKSEFESDMAGFKQRIPMLLSPWFRYFVAYDPAGELEKIKIPVLALNGSNDLQVPADVNMEGIKAALEKAGNKNHKLIKLEGLNHLFQASETGSPVEYAKIEETFSPEALKIIRDWILEITSR